MVEPPEFRIQNSEFRIKSAGFTLIELLVVITIIGILSAIGISMYESTQAKARDARRKADINEIMKAITAYVGDNGVPPPTDANNGDGGACVAGQLIFGCPFTGASGSPIYMNKVPNAPRHGVTACGIGGWAGAVTCRYWYIPSVIAGMGCTNSILYNKPYVSTYLESDKGNGDDCAAGLSALGLYFKEP